MWQSTSSVPFCMCRPRLEWPTRSSLLPWCGLCGRGKQSKSKLTNSYIQSIMQHYPALNHQGLDFSWIYFLRQNLKSCKRKCVYRTERTRFPDKISHSCKSNNMLTHPKRPPVEPKFVAWRGHFSTWLDGTASLLGAGSFPNLSKSFQLIKVSCCRQVTGFCESESEERCGSVEISVSANNWVLYCINY